MGRLIRSVLGSEDSKPSSSPLPPLPPNPNPVPSPTGGRMRVVAGGHAHLTGAKEKGPQGKNLNKEEGLRSSFPTNVWLAFDCTPKDQFGKDFGPMPDSERGKTAEEQANPEFEGVPTFDGDPNTQALRLVWDYDGKPGDEGDVDLVHEYANHGCTPRIKCVQAHGTLRNLRFLAANGVVIPVREGTIRIGID